MIENEEDSHYYNESDWCLFDPNEFNNYNINVKPSLNHQVASNKLTYYTYLNKSEKTS